MDEERKSLEGRLILGIDLGTTKSGVSIWDAELQRARMLQNEDGAEIIPSVVAWDRERREWLLGEAARRMEIDHAQDVVYSIKRCIGRWYNDRKVAEIRADLPYRLVTGGGTDQLRDVLVDFGTEVDSPDPPLLAAPAISAKVLAELRRIAARALGLSDDAVRHAVITVPAYFDVLQRRATRLAGEMAGLTVAGILNEPTAALLAYAAAYGDEVVGPDWRTILVYDLGGGTFDISILEAQQLDGGYQVLTLGVDGDTRLGGDDIDMAIVRWLEGEIERTCGREVRPNDHHTRAVLRLEAERAKVRLSTEPIVMVRLRELDPESGSPFEVDLELTRDQLEACAADVLTRARDITRHAVERVQGLSWDQIDQVILVGGQTLMPAVQRSVEALSGKKPRLLDWPQQAVARGAGEYAHALALGQEGFQDRILSHVIALPLGIRLEDNTFKPVVEANKTVPHLSDPPLSVTTTEDGQRRIVVEVLQQPREARTADECVSLGKIEMEVPPAPAGSPHFTVQFDVLEDGTMKVVVSDTRRKRRSELDIVESGMVTWRDPSLTDAPGENARSINGQE